jgi:hypothetical protein
VNLADSFCRATARADSWATVFLTVNGRKLPTLADRIGVKTVSHHAASKEKQTATNTLKTLIYLAFIGNFQKMKNAV